MDLGSRFAAVPYHGSLGLQVESLTPEAVRLRLSFRDENANPGRALHGGATASTIDAAGALAAWSALGAGDGFEVATLDLSVNFLAAAIGEDIIASAEVLRRGKELVYSLIDVRTDAGKRIAVGLSTYRGVEPSVAAQGVDRQLVTPPPAAASAVDMIKGARMFVSTPFMARLGLGVEMAHGGAARLAMPCTPDTTDADGAIHEGALAALIDSSGALSAWSVVGLDLRFKASTVGIHVSYHGRVPSEAVVAHARTVRRNNEIFFNQVTVVGRDSQVVVAAGEVTYRIVV